MDLTTVKYEDSGVYICIGTNLYGQVNASFIVDVIGELLNMLGFMLCVETLLNEYLKIRYTENSSCWRWRCLIFMQYLFISSYTHVGKVNFLCLIINNIDYFRKYNNVWFLFTTMLNFNRIHSISMCMCMYGYIRYSGFSYLVLNC